MGPLYAELSVRGASYRALVHSEYLCAFELYLKVLCVGRQEYSYAGHAVQRLDGNIRLDEQRCERRRENGLEGRRERRQGALRTGNRRKGQGKQAYGSKALFQHGKTPVSMGLMAWSN